MQTLHPFAGSLQEYFEEISNPDRYRPDHCPQCDAQQPCRATSSTAVHSWTLPLMVLFACAVTYAACANVRFLYCPNSP